MLRVELDWIVGVIRCGGENFKGHQPGTSYDFVCGVMRKGDEAYLYGAHGDFNRQMHKQIVGKLKNAGIKSYSYERLNTEKLRLVEKEL